MDRRKFAFGALVVTSSAALGLGVKTLNDEIDFEPSPVLTGNQVDPGKVAQLLADTYKGSETSFFSAFSTAHEMNKADLGLIAEQYRKAGPAAVMVNNSVAHKFEVRGVAINGEPALALYEKGERAGTAKGWKSGLRAAAIYEAAEEPARAEPQANSQRAVTYTHG
ncbi:MAG: hypothetical protein M3N08_10095 [Pseudomonadota bacterium]|nr:hypothetical protein [Pseudomonadota bacterium]